MDEPVERHELPWVSSHIGPTLKGSYLNQCERRKDHGLQGFHGLQKSASTRLIREIRDGMKSFSNRRCADREVWCNVPGGTRECLQHALVAEGPKVR